MDFEDSDYTKWLKNEGPPIRPLTREEAQALNARHPSLSVWQLLAWQAACGVLVALIWGALSRNPVAAVSALYGGAVAVIPNAVMARGTIGRRAGRSVGGLLFWEIVKLGLVGAMLVLAPVWIKPLNWLAMLVALVLCLKVFGVVLFIQRRREKRSS